MADKEYTYSDVSEHNTKKDLFIVVHDKVYNASSFVDEHPYVAPARHTHTHTHTSPKASSGLPVLVVAADLATALRRSCSSVNRCDKH